MRKHGIVNPILTLRAARAAELELATACAILEQETGGGKNIFGHDPSIFRGAGAVTKAKYLAYKRARVASDNTEMQGVGPVQLTWWSLQDEADAAGGCWRPRINMTVGFRRAAHLIHEYGLAGGIRRYNGSGPAALRYARSVMDKRRSWQKVFGTRPLPKKLPLRERALRIALEEAKKGVHEEGGNNRGPRVREYLKEVGLGEGFSWCDAFVSWCLHRAAGHRLPIESAGVIITWAEARKRGWLVSRPLRGDLFMPDFNGNGRFDDHVGFVVRVLKLGPLWTLRTVEGNTGSVSQSDGDGVYVKTRVCLASRVAFVRVPG